MNSRTLTNERVQEAHQSKYKNHIKRYEIINLPSTILVKLHNNHYYIADIKWDTHIWFIQENIFFIGFIQNFSRLSLKLQK